MKILLIDDDSDAALELARQYIAAYLHSGRPAGRHNPVIYCSNGRDSWIMWHNPAKTQVTVKYVSLTREEQ